VRRLFLFVNSDRRHSYCLYEVPSADMIATAVKRVGLPAHTVVEVNRISADAYT
jgi:Protein of unknown function (DUF4242)